MDKKHLTKLEREYLDLYGNIPTDHDDLISYIRDTYNLSNDAISE